MQVRRGQKRGRFKKNRGCTSILSTPIGLASASFLPYFALREDSGSVVNPTQLRLRARQRTPLGREEVPARPG
jgi:hypothetical protein